jgi:mono/diheme cytochrome c family protein
MRIRSSIRLSAASLAFAGLLPSLALGQNFERGQELFEHHCHGCHGDLRFVGQEGKVKKLADLRGKVASWAEHGGTQWGKSEVDDVTYYMDKSFYHFKSGKD